MAHNLANKKTTAYQIVHTRGACETTRYAAAELAKFLGEITGANFPVVDDSVPVFEHEIWVGQSGRTEGLDVDWEICQKEGYYVKSFGKHLLLAGNTARAHLYAVYDLLEESLGCRWFTAEVSRIPKRSKLALPDLDKQITPVLEYREPFFTEAFDGDWAARNRCNSQTASLEKRHGGKVVYKGFVHTFANFVPSSVYFDEHPEYFAEIDGLRRKGETDQHTQLCLTNPDVLRIVTEKVLSWLAETPDANIISVSQNDSVWPCRCEACRKIDEEEDSYAGTLLRFVNAVAEAVEKHYPNVSIDTLAYQYTRRAPKLTRPRKNVIIRLCSIECCFTHPLGTCADVSKARNTKDQDFLSDLRDWAKICDRIYIWDYVTDFSHYLLPFPNIDVLQDNVRFFVENSAKGIFEQGAYAPGGGGFAAELKAYLLAKCLWNPNYDGKRAVSEFLTGVYGGAAYVMGQIFDAYRQEVLADDVHMGCFLRPQYVYNRPGFLDSVSDLFDEAERMADDEAALRQVKKARLWQRFAELTKRDHADKAVQAEIDAFAADCKAFGVERLDEGRLIDPYVAAWKEKWPW